MLAVVIEMMEGTVFHVHLTIIVGLLKAEHSAAKIHTLLRLLKVIECHVYHVQKLFEETGDVCDACWVVHTCFTQNSCCEQKIVYQEMNLALRNVLHVLIEDLGLRAYKRFTRHLLNAHLRRLQLERSKKLLCLW